LLNREEWLHLAHKLDWRYSYAREEDIFPEVISGHPYLPHSEWQDWEEHGFVQVTALHNTHLEFAPPGSFPWPLS
jgi:hypothetical protein